jgi:nucleoside-diphosphate-sugar epimerase
VLVTGASGFIGRALVSRLKWKNLAVIPMDSLYGDISSPATFAKLEGQDISHVFHLAGRTFVPDSWEEPQAFCNTNVVGTFNVLEFCRKKRTPMTYVSAYVYGHPDSLPIRENSEIRPSNPYALTKRMAEEACEFYATAHDLPITTIRPFNVYGIGQGANFLIPSIIHQVLNETKITVKDLQPKRDYVYLEDLLNALLATLSENSKGYNVYNIGSGMSITVKEVIDVIQKVSGTNKEVVSDNVVRTSELMNVVADISKAKSELGWHPEYSFEAGIKCIIYSEREKRRYEHA